MTKYKSLLIFGPPGSGKGTQGEVLGSVMGFFHCSSGDVFRNLNPDSELGLLCRSYSSRGELVPDDVTINVWKDHMERQIAGEKFNAAKHLLILDGIPRNANQALVLDPQIDVLKIILLDVSDEEKMVQRLKGRALKQGRADDAKEDVIRRRLQVYHDETAPVLAHYPSSIVAKVDALQTPAEVLRDILGIVIPVQNEQQSA